jgi:hypothetical protein
MSLGRIVFSSASFVIQSFKGSKSTYRSRGDAKWSKSISCEMFGSSEWSFYKVKIIFYSNSSKVSYFTSFVVSLV